MYQRSQIPRSRLRSGLTGVFLLLLFAINHAKAGLLPPPPPVPLAGPVLIGTLFFNLIQPVDFVDFGNYFLFQPPPPGKSDGSRMHFRAVGTPAPFLGGDIDAVPNHFGRAFASLTYEMEVLGPPGSVPIQIDVSGRVFGNLDPGDRLGALVLKSNWSLEDVVLGPVASDAIDSGVQHEFFSQSFSHAVPVTMLANHVHRVTMFVDMSVQGGEFGGNVTAFIDPVFSFAPGVDPSYSFQFSEGIGNSSTEIPEPSAVVLLSTGAIAIGLLRRRSKLRRLATPEVPVR
jgi:hypothetical protein